MDITDKKVIDKIHKELKIKLSSDYGPVKIYNAYKKVGNKYFLPHQWSKNNIENYTKTFPEKRIIKIDNCKISLRPIQLECMKEIDKEMEKPEGGGIINLSTGTGKTILSIHVISKYKLKTLIVVNTVELMNQWKKTIQTLLPNCKIGTIQGNVFKEGDITIGMLQTISMRDTYTPDMFKNFSLCFIDECHHISSYVFSNALYKIRNRYIFGLSATVERKDGLEWVFKAHIGGVLFSNINNDSKQQTTVKKIFYKGNLKERYMYSGKPNISSMITEIAEDKQRTKQICEVLIESIKEEDRMILVLSDRLSQLNCIHKILGNEISGLFIGSTSENDKSVSKTKRILLATYNIASEGFDHPKLNCVLFATPRSNITQSVGRIYRKIHQIDPLIIDVIDSYSIFPYQFKKREKVYKKLNSKTELTESECLFD